VSSNIENIYENRQLNWGIVSVLVILHLGAVGALFMFSWRAVLISVLLYWVSVGLGISMGYHRLHTHRSYKLPRPLEYFLRDFVARRRTDLLGGDASHPSPVFRPAR
jgi:fatty-acid desaturase